MVFAKHSSIFQACDEPYAQATLNGVQLKITGKLYHLVGVAMK